jgi:CRP/FNR family cyclic AMP-dependent transcriptional regulator
MPIASKMQKGVTMIETLRPILAEHPFFQGMDEGLLEIIVGCACNVRFEKDDMIFREGEEANKFYLIRSGKVALQLFADRRGPLTVTTLEDGDILGWSWLSPPYRWKFTARALEVTRAISLDGKCLREKSERDNHLGYELLKRFVHIIEGRLQATRLQLLNVYQIHA